MTQQPFINPPSGRAYRVAKFISDIINPMVVGVFLIALVAFKAVQEPAHALGWLAFTVTLVAVPPLAYLKHLVRVGYLVDIYMPNRKRRRKPVSLIFAWLIICLSILTLFNAPKVLVFMVAAVLVQVTFMGVITFLWKISFHSAAIMTAATVSIFLRTDLLWFVTMLVPAVGWARVQMHRHTVMQVFGGYLAGYLTGLVGIYMIAPYML